VHDVQEPQDPAEDVDGEGEFCGHESHNEGIRGEEHEEGFYPSAFILSELPCFIHMFVHCMHHTCCISHPATACTAGEIKCTGCEYGLEAEFECTACPTEYRYFCSEECFISSHKRVKEENHILKELHPDYPTCDLSPFRGCSGGI